MGPHEAPQPERLSRRSRAFWFFEAAGLVPALSFGFIAAVDPNVSAKFLEHQELGFAAIWGMVIGLAAPFLGRIVSEMEFSETTSIRLLVIGLLSAAAGGIAGISLVGGEHVAPAMAASEVAAWGVGNVLMVGLTD